MGPHVQERDAEMVVILSGHGAASIEGVRHELSRGVCLGLGFGGTLALENSSQTEELEYLIIKATPPSS